MDLNGTTRCKVDQMLMFLIMLSPGCRPFGLSRRLP
jgi:hypothetical protein